MPLFGSHLSIAGNMANALREAESLGMDTVQVFTKNQRQWKVTPLKDEDAAEWASEVKRLGWQGRIVAHNSYLINMASPDGALWEKSVALQREEIERCERLGIPFLVSHPGAHTGSGADAGIERIGACVARLLAETPGYTTVLCLENTVGAGSNLGGDFRQLALLRGRILDSVKGRAGANAEARIGFCFDTCHAHASAAAGYSMRGRENALRTLALFDECAGLRHVRAVHLNDSKAPAGSGLDRHAHIGEGAIAGPIDGDGRRDYSGFAAVLNHPLLAGVPMVLETPKEDTDKGGPWDAVNLQRLRTLIEAAPAGPAGPGRSPRSRGVRKGVSGPLARQKRT